MPGRDYGFLRSLMKNWDGKVVAVIVSGFDGDGAAALSGIKEAGGVTIAQKPDTAGQPDMPESAIASGYIDFILSSEDIVKEIIRIARACKNQLMNLCDWIPDNLFYDPPHITAIRNMVTLCNS